MLRRRLNLILAFALGASAPACTDEGPHDDASDEVASGMLTTRAGLAMAGEGMLLHGQGDSRGLGMVRSGVDTMDEGEAEIHGGLDGMATVYVAGGRYVVGLGPNSRCGAVGQVMLPFDNAMVQLDVAVAMMGDGDPTNDAAGDLHFHAGKVAMAQSLDGVRLAMGCMRTG